MYAEKDGYHLGAPTESNRPATELMRETVNA